MCIKYDRALDKPFELKTNPEFAFM